MIQTDRERQIIALAQEQHGDGIDVIDDEEEGHVIEAFAGAYCLAWVWVRFSGTTLDTVPSVPPIQPFVDRETSEFAGQRFRVFSGFIAYSDRVAR